MKCETRDTPRNAAQQTKINAIRRKYQRRKPSLTQLAHDADFEAPVTMQTKLAMMRAAAHLKRLREKQRLSLSRLAQESGIDKSMLSRLENGAYNNATLLTMNRYARVLGEEVDFAFRKATAIEAPVSAEPAVKPAAPARKSLGTRQRAAKRKTGDTSVATTPAKKRQRAHGAVRKSNGRRTSG